MAVPSGGYDKVVVGVEVFAIGQRYGIGGGEGVGQTEAFARRADEKDLVGLRGFEVVEQGLATVAGEGAPVVAVAVEDGVVRVVVLSTPCNPAAGGAVDGAAESSGVGIVGEGKFGEPDPTASRGAAGADGKTVVGGVAAAELYVEFLQGVGLLVVDRGHLHKGVGIGGVGEGAEVEVDVVVVGGGEIGVDPFAAQRVAGGQGTQQDGVVVAGPGREGYNLLVVLGFG